MSTSVTSQAEPVAEPVAEPIEPVAETVTPIRFYSRDFPAVGDILVIKMTEISNGGVYGYSVEYPGLRVYILPTEISRRKVNLKKLFSQDKFYPTRVLSVDVRKGLADVSYSKLTDRERADCLERFTTYQKIYRLGLDATNICTKVGNIPPAEAMELVFRNGVWAILENLVADSRPGPDQIPIKSIVDRYTSLLENPANLFGTSCPEVPGPCITAYVESLKDRVKVSDVIISSEVTLLVLERDAVTRLRQILTTDLDPHTKVEYVASPRYKVTVTDPERATAEKLLTATLSRLRENSMKFGGTFVSSTDPLIQRDKTYTLTKNLC